jgi:hypothetical protein
LSQRRGKKTRRGGRRVDKKGRDETREGIGRGERTRLECEHKGGNRKIMIIKTGKKVSNYNNLYHPISYL